MAHFKKEQEPAGRFIGKTRFRISEPLAYYSNIHGGWIKVPAGFETDFASIPRILWRVLPPWDAHRRAAIIHDYLYANQLTTRKLADQIFLEAMECLGISWLKRHAMYRGVRMGGWKAWSDHEKKLVKAGVFLALCLMLTGCAFHRTTETTMNPDGTHDRTTFVGISFFNRTAVEGLTVGKRSTNETSTLTIGKASTETQAEAIKASGEALGAGIAAGIKKTLVP